MKAKNKSEIKLTENVVKMKQISHINSKKYFKANTNNSKLQPLETER